MEDLDRLLEDISQGELKELLDPVPEDHLQSLAGRSRFIHIVLEGHPPAETEIRSALRKGGDVEEAYRILEDSHAEYEDLSHSLQERLAEPYYEHMMEKDEFLEAAQVARDQSLENKNIEEAAKKAYDSLIEKGSPGYATRIAFTYNLGKERIGLGKALMEEMGQTTIADYSRETDETEDVSVQGSV